MNTVIDSVVTDCTLIYVEVDENSNKVWKGKVTEAGSFVAEWGRVGSKLQSRQHNYHSVPLALDHYERLKRQKLKKGYTPAAVLGDAAITDITEDDIDKIALSQINHGEDERAKNLIRYLVEVNIHQITSQTNISYDRQTGAWRTPLGLVTTQAIREAREYLLQIATATRSNSSRFNRLVSQYLRLIPQNLGHKIDASIFASPSELQRQQEILDALDAAVKMSNQTGKIFESTLRRVPGSTTQGKQTFRYLRQLYESTVNPNHLSANYKLRRVYEIEIPSMQEAFKLKAAQIGNTRLHWHGTKASNLLSIIRQGLIIPPADAAYCTGRMFGNGIYGSEQSTKALNYATNYWNSNGDSQRVFMLLCEFAMGREYRPKNWNRGSFPQPGYDSTYISPGNASIMNQESIVYSVDQVNIKYLCEFE